MIKRCLLFLDWKFLVLPLFFPPFYFQLFSSTIPYGDLFLYVYSAATFVYFLTKHKTLTKNKSFLFILLFAVYVVIQLCIFPEIAGQGQKIRKLLIQGVAYFIAGALLNTDIILFKFFQVYILSISFVRSIAVLAMFSNIICSYDNVLQRSNYQVFSYYIAMGVVAHISIMFNTKYRFIKAMAATILVISLFMTGGTGAIVAIFLSLSVGFVAWLYTRREEMITALNCIVSVLFAGTLGLMVVSSTGQVPYSLTAFVKKSTNVVNYIFYPEKLNGMNKSGESIFERLNIYQETIPIISDNIVLGVGLGNWKNSIEKSKNKETIYEYSHNIVLELLSETGIIGLVIFSLAIYFAIIPIGDTGCPRVFVGKIGLLYLLFIHCISGDLTDSWLYLFLGMASVAVSQPRHESQCGVASENGKNCGPSGFPVGS